MQRIFDREEMAGPTLAVRILQPLRSPTASAVRHAQPAPRLRNTIRLSGCVQWQAQQRPLRSGSLRAQRRRAVGDGDVVAHVEEEAAVGPLRAMQALLDAPPLETFSTSEGEQWKARLLELLEVRVSLVEGLRVSVPGSSRRTRSNLFLPWLAVTASKPCRCVHLQAKRTVVFERGRSGFDWGRLSGFDWGRLSLSDHAAIFPLAPRRDDRVGVGKSRVACGWWGMSTLEPVALVVTSP